MDNVLFSKNSDEWTTPESVFDTLDAEFNFTLDPCATSGNHKCDQYFTKDQDGLTKNWGGAACSAIHRTAGSLNGSGNVIRNH